MRTTPKIASKVVVSGGLPTGYAVNVGFVGVWQAYFLAPKMKRRILFAL
jgi:hypothetical protein